MGYIELVIKEEIRVGDKIRIGFEEGICEFLKWSYCDFQDSDMRDCNNCPGLLGYFNKDGEYNEKCWICNDSLVEIIKKIEYIGDEIWEI